MEDFKSKLVNYENAELKESSGTYRVLGIDPGTRVMGYGLLQGSKGRKSSLVAVGSISLLSERDAYRRLLLIYRSVEELIACYSPTQVAIEAPFFGKNAQSMLKLGRAQGVAIAAVMACGLDVQEYAPRKVKITVTGSGEATKEQVRAMLGSLYPEAPICRLKHLDATDGLAVAYCHFHQGISVGHTGQSSWADFVAKQPERVKDFK